MKPLLKKGDHVRIRREWQDDGDSEFTWIAIDDEDKGRVTIQPLGTGLRFQPNQVVEVSMLERK